MDEEGCILLIIGEHDGGAVFFHEPRLVVESCHGLVMTFPSNILTHGTLPFKGERASLVMHMDCRSASFQKDGNSWDLSDYFR